MRPFTYDFESVELSAHECASYAGIVSRETHYANQHTVSRLLESVTRVPSPRTLDYLSAVLYLLWRREAA